MQSEEALNFQAQLYDLAARFEFAVTSTDYAMDPSRKDPFVWPDRHIWAGVDASDEVIDAYLGNFQGRVDHRGEASKLEAIVSSDRSKLHRIRGDLFGYQGRLVLLSKEEFLQVGDVLYVEHRGHQKAYKVLGVRDVVRPEDAGSRVFSLGA